MNRVFKTLVAVLPLFAALSCTDLTEVNNKLDSLDSRVSALETAVNSLNKNILALTELAQNQTIQSVIQEGDTYKITLANGTVLEIYQGSMGVANTPILSIDEDGYWQVDYGAGPEPVLQNGKKVYALGNDGITPIFGVDADNYWIVSYDGGKTWQNVLYTSGEHEGEKVLAYNVNGSDSYFHNVEYDEQNSVFILTLKNGQVYTIPVVRDFKCVVLDVDQVQKFDYEQVRTYTVQMSGVSDYTIIAPNGWSAILQGDQEMKILKITAPAAPTKATIADSEADVTIIAFTPSGLSTSARIEVALTGKELDRNPFTSPSKISVGTSEATVRVLVENAEDWYYLLTTDSAAPHASEIIADGVKGTESVFTLTGLKQAYTYYLYTTAINGGALAPVAVCSFTTGITNDRYQAFLDGEDIIICGRHYNISNVPTYSLLTATKAADNALTKPMQNGGIIFLETPEGTYFDPAPGIDVSNEHETIVVGRYADNYAKISVSTGRIYPKSGLAMQFIEFDGSARNGNELGTKTTTKFVHFDSCRIRHRNGYGLVVGTEEARWLDLRFHNNDFHFVGSGGSMHLISTGKWKNIALTENLEFQNNIFYCPVDTRMHLFFPGENFDKNNLPTETFRTNVLIKNNTFYGCASDWSMLRLYVADKINIERNIFWFYPNSVVPQADVVDLFGDDGKAPSVVFEYNIAFRGDIRALAGNVNPSYLPDPNTVIKLSVDPLAADPSKYDFTPIPAYSKYGAQRQ